MTCLVAVAVRAMMGSRGNSRLMTASRRYAGRKSCPAHQAACACSPVPQQLIRGSPFTLPRESSHCYCLVHELLFALNRYTQVRSLGKSNLAVQIFIPSTVSYLFRLHAVATQIKGWLRANRTSMDLLPCLAIVISMANRTHPRKRCSVLHQWPRARHCV